MALSTGERAQFADTTVKTVRRNQRAALLAVDAKLAAIIERLQGVREVVARLRAHGIPAKLPGGVGMAAQAMSEGGPKLSMVDLRVLVDDAVHETTEIVQAGRGAADTEPEMLSPHADVATQARLAEKRLPELASLQTKSPRLANPATKPSSGQPSRLDTVGEAMTRMFSLAQVEALYHVGLRATGQTEARLRTPEVEE